MYLSKIFKKYSHFFLITTTLFILLLMGGLGLFTFPNADDFCIANGVKDKGIKEFIINHYNNWNGRYTSISILALFFYFDFIKYYSFLPIIIIFLTFLSFYVLFASVNRFIRNLNKINLINHSLLFTVIYFLLLPNLSQTLYWASASLTFLIGNIFVILFLSLIITNFNFNNSYLFLLKIIIGFFLTLIIVGTNELSMFVTLLLILVSFIFSKSLKDIIFFSIFFLATAIFISIVVLAPGNLIRLNNLNDIYILNNTYLGSIIFIPWAVLRFLFWSTNFTLIIYLLMLMINETSLVCSLNNLKKKIKISNFFIILGFILLNLSGFILHKLPMPERAESVIALYFLVLIFYFFFSSGLSNKLLKIIVFLRRKKYLINYLFAASLLGHPNNFNLYKDIYYGYRFFLENKNIISIVINEKNNGNLDIIVPSFSKLPTHLVPSALTTNPADMRNSCIAKYYGVNSIVVGPKKN